MIEVWAEKYLNETNDRCWFCQKNGCDEFDTEFDTFLHKECLIQELQHDPDNPEAELMKYLLEE
jgi:hypothetical protein